tara:strand:- start:477 stop:683 length:207 start_codon:yes stop_codon:yes gene_type:complete
MANLSPDVTFHFFMKDASIYYNEDMETLMIYSDHSDKVVIDGIKLKDLKESIKDRYSETKARKRGQIK